MFTYECSCVCQGSLWAASAFTFCPNICFLTGPRVAREHKIFRFRFSGFLSETLVQSAASWAKKGDEKRRVVSVSRREYTFKKGKTKLFRYSSTTTRYVWNRVYFWWTTRTGLLLLEKNNEVGLEKSYCKKEGSKTYNPPSCQVTSDIFWMHVVVQEYVFW